MYIMLPFEPQEMKTMMARYHEAVKETNDVELIAAGKAPVPSKDRKHVFDFPDGLRVIVSVDKVGVDLRLHVSCSGNDEYVKDSGVEISKNLDLFFQEVKEKARNRISEMRGEPLPLREEQFVLDHGVLHLLFSGADERLRIAALPGVTV